MAVVGIDFGTQNSIVAHAVRGGVDIILNESSKRQNPYVFTKMQTGGARFCSSVLVLGIQ